ncbi:MAG: hypothetical protein ACRDRI_17870 [Pseudonocardiaceae bacterium]
MREKIWTFLGRHAGGVQWRILWFAHTKYIVGVSGLVRNSLVTGFTLRAEVAYLAEFVGGSYRPDPKEVLDAGFFDIDELPDGLLPQHRDLIERHRSWFKGDDVDRAHAQRKAHGHTAPETGDL